MPAPFDMPLPLEILYRLMFTEENGQTTITLTGQPLNASPEETAAFLSIGTSMEQGFSAPFDQLSVYLE